MDQAAIALFTQPPPLLLESVAVWHPARICISHLPLSLKARELSMMKNKIVNAKYFDRIAQIMGINED